MEVTVVGTGYVGLVSGACLAEMGNHVVCLDTDAELIGVLAAGGLPIRCGSRFRAGPAHGTVNQV